MAISLKLDQNLQTADISNIEHFLKHIYTGRSENLSKTKEIQAEELSNPYTVSLTDCGATWWWAGPTPGKGAWEPVWST